MSLRLVSGIYFRHAGNAGTQRRADTGANAQAPAHLIAFVRLSI